MKVVVLTTSYPRHEGDVAGRFVADAVKRVRAAGVTVTVVAPTAFRHFGIAYGAGIAQNLRAAPWKLLVVPAFLAGYARTARRAARGADLVHAHWIPSALAARATGKPYVLTVWGTDVAFARRAPALFRPLITGARIVIAPSPYLAAEARRFGAADVRVVPYGIEIPPLPGPSDEPPHVLFAGRLSPEKGILEFVEATEGLPRRVVGDGPLRSGVPAALGFVPPSEMGGYYERAAVVCVPSRREGYGITARQAMAHGRAVVATRVGGLADAIEHGRTGLLVEPGRPDELRGAVERLLDDAELRARLGAAARAHAASAFSVDVELEQLLAVYRDAAA